VSLQAQLDRLLPADETPANPRAEHLRILLLDIETYPALTWQWSLWDKFTPTERIVREGGLLSWAAKWYAEPETEFSAVWTDGQQGMAERMHGLLSEADAVVTYNGNRFDLPWLRTAVELDSGMGPTSPFASVDLYATVKRFRFLSNKLGYVTDRLSLGAKLDTGGFRLWTDAMPPELGGNGDPEAQARMEAYNRADVADTLEPLYDALLPWVKGHPHVGLYDESAVNRCQRCGSTELERAGYARTPLGVYARYRCAACRSWSRGKRMVSGVDARGI
jgi:hypothetical protein